MSASAPSDFPEFRFVNVARPQNNVFEVRWVLNPTPYPLEDIVFEVMRSNSPNGPWDVLGIVESGKFSWTDYSVLGDPVARNYYYAVRMASVSGKGYRDSDPVIMQHDADNIALELVRKKNVYLTVKGGISVAVLLKKSWGAKCPRCWNKERMQATDPDCHACFGTGFSGGFMNPVFVPALFNPPKALIVEAGLQYEPYNVYVELANHPVVNVKDIVVDRKQNLRFEVSQITVTSRRMHMISQIAVLNRVDENSIIYTIDIPEPVHAAEGRSWDMVERTRDLPND